MLARRTVLRITVASICAAASLIAAPAARAATANPVWDGPVGTVYLTPSTPYSAHFTVTTAPGDSSLTLTAFPLGLTATWYSGDYPGLGNNGVWQGTISGQLTSPTGPAGAPVSFRLDSQGGSWTYSFLIRVWQASAVTVMPAQWSGSGAALSSGAVRLAHSASASTAGAVTFVSDSVSQDSALTPGTVTSTGTTAPAPGATILTAPSTCQGQGPSNSGQLLYHGQASATTAPVWKLARDAAGAPALRPLFSLLTPADFAAVPPSALVACASNQVDAAGAPITRIVAATPGSYSLSVGDVDTGTSQAPRWTTIDAPPLTLSGGLRLPGTVTTAPSLSPAAPGEYDLAEVAADGITWVRHFSLATGWGPWTSLGGSAASGVSLTSTGPGRLAVAALGTDGTVDVDALHNGVWTGWSRVGGLTFASNRTPVIVATTGANADIVALGNDNHPYRLHMTP